VGPSQRGRLAAPECERRAFSAKSVARRPTPRRDRSKILPEQAGRSIRKSQGPPGARRDWAKPVIFGEAEVAVEPSQLALRRNGAEGAASVEDRREPAPSRFLVLADRHQRHRRHRPEPLGEQPAKERG